MWRRCRGFAAFRSRVGVVARRAANRGSPSSKMLQGGPPRVRIIPAAAVATATHSAVLKSTDMVTFCLVGAQLGQLDRPE